MKTNYTLFLIFFLTLKIFSQNKHDREVILKSTNVEKLNQISEDFLEAQNLFNYKNAKRTKIDSKGENQFFSHYDKSGNAVYYSLENESSAISSKVDRIRTGGSTGLDLDGTGIEFGLWDSGSPRATHQEFNNNITNVDGTSVAFHATHIAGILIASGVEAEAKGMAPGATIDAYSTSGWLSEVASWAAAGGLISTHSYILANPKEDYEGYGVYNTYSKWWDELSNNAPYLVMCTGASNNGSKGYNPDGSRYDLLASNKLGKNSIVVGASYDVLDYTGPNSVSQSWFTSWGPTDDWRIKPDITAVGVSSYSTREGSDTDYDTGNGCSYAGPIVAGGLALLQEHYHNNNAVYMKATTAKALILSTTDEAGTYDGPDFSNGWGLFNAENAAEVITNKGISSIISEQTLNEDESYSVTITVDGTQSLSVALCWNDPAAIPLTSGTYNDSTPMLINDLDVRLTSDSNTYYPWLMEPNSTLDNYTDAAIKGDNYRDNIEIINVESIDAGTYAVNVSHKGDLQDGSQDFSLIINGIKKDTLNKDTLSNTDVNIENTITVYPNPTNDFLNIKLNSYNSEILKVSLYNIMGQKTLETQYTNQNSIKLDVSNMPKGLYMLKVKENDNDVLIKKIIIE